MSGTAITRAYHARHHKAIGTTPDASDPINLQPYAGGRIYITAGAGLTTLTWFDCHELAGTYKAAQDGNGNAVTSQVAPGQSCPIPPALFASMFVKAVGDAAATSP
jgi:hypothetical protein